MRSLSALLVSLFCILPELFLSQNLVRDSLRLALRSSKHDTALALTYVSLGEDFYLDNPDSAYSYFQKTKAISEINLKRKLDPVVKKAFLNHLGTSMQNTGLIL